MKVAVRTVGHVIACSWEPINRPRIWRVVLRYDPADPYAVHMDLSCGCDGEDYEHETVTWIYARELLALGLSRPVDYPAGHMDVQVWTEGPTVRLRLSTPDGTSVLAVPYIDVSRFVRRSYRTVPDGREADHLDVDAAIRALLSEVD